MADMAYPGGRVSQKCAVNVCGVPHICCIVCYGFLDMKSHRLEPTEVNGGADSWIQGPQVEWPRIQYELNVLQHLHIVL